MKIYSLYSTSHEDLVNKWFLPTLPKSFEIVLEKTNQSCITGKFNSRGWLETMIAKVELILRAINENWGDSFVYSDVDLQFFQDVTAELKEAIINYDIVFQRDTPWGTVCAGFFISRANNRTKQLWQDIHKNLQSIRKENDQRILNRSLISKYGIKQICYYGIFHTYKYFSTNLIKPLNETHQKNSFEVSWNYLPPEFFGAGTVDGKVWKKGSQLSIPNNIKLHHANWTYGIEQKALQLQYVRDLLR